jgi:predicted NBD/HSP70 family sugar kinase
MKPAKATSGQVKRHNRQMLLRAVYEGSAGNRAALAHETGLTKPAVSDLIGELIDDGLLVEEGFGESTDSGGKRPRLLKFVANARQVIGVSISEDYILGVLTNLDGRIIAEHYCELVHTQKDEVFSTLVEVINGLVAQLTAPLMCLGVGVAAVVDADAGRVRYAAHFGWHDVPLATKLTKHYNVPAYISNSTELAALAQSAFGNIKNAESLATVLVGDSVGVGLMMANSTFYTGSDIGYLILNGHTSAANSHSAIEGPLEKFVGWSDVKRRALDLAQRHHSRELEANNLTYLHIRHALHHADPAAMALQDELTGYLAQIFAWIIALLRPHHISLAGSIADLGEEFLQQVVDKTQQLVLPELVEATLFSVDNSTNLVAIGAAAKSVQHELGLV